MIASLSGAVAEIGPDEAVIDVAGVGYRVFCSARTLARLPPAGSPARLAIETHVRDDHIHLYGFADALERDWFRLLTTVQGVGPRLAVAILSVAPAEQLARTILAQDKAVLTRADGVGARLAARIVNELKDKLGGMAGSAGPDFADPPAAEIGAEGAAADAISALENLGVRRSDALGAVVAAARRLGTDAKVDALIKAGLQELSR